MSSTANHKKMFTILQAAIADKKLLMAVMFQAMRDNPGAIAGAFDKVAEEIAKGRKSGDQFHGTSGVSPGYGPWHKNDLWQCPDCKKFVSKLGIAGACIKCDPSGFDVPY